jgi:hypothetical protein
MVRNKLGIFDIVCIKCSIECDIVVCEFPLFVRFEEAMCVFWVDIRRDDVSNRAIILSDD